MVLWPSELLAAVVTETGNGKEGGVGNETDDTLFGGVCNHSDESRLAYDLLRVMGEQTLYP